MEMEESRAVQKKQKAILKLVEGADLYSGFDFNSCNDCPSLTNVVYCLAVALVLIPLVSIFPLAAIFVTLSCSLVVSLGVSQQCRFPKKNV